MKEIEGIKPEAYPDRGCALGLATLIYIWYNVGGGVLCQK